MWLCEQDVEFLDEDRIGVVSTYGFNRTDNQTACSFTICKAIWAVVCYVKGYVKVICTVSKLLIYLLFVIRINVCIIATAVVILVVSNNNERICIFTGTKRDIEETHDTRRVGISE